MNKLSYTLLLSSVSAFTYSDAATFMAGFFSGAGYSDIANAITLANTCATDVSNLYNDAESMYNYYEQGKATCGSSGPYPCWSVTSATNTALFAIDSGVYGAVSQTISDWDTFFDQCLEEKVISSVSQSSAAFAESTLVDLIPGVSEIKASLDLLTASKVVGHAILLWEYYDESDWSNTGYEVGAIFYDLNQFLDGSMLALPTTYDNTTTSNSSTITVTGTNTNLSSTSNITLTSTVYNSTDTSNFTTENYTLTGTLSLISMNERIH